MTLTAASFCMAALVSMGTAKTPSQPAELHHANLGMVSGNTTAWTGTASAPTGAEVILARGTGLRGG